MSAKQKAHKILTVAITVEDGKATVSTSINVNGYSIEEARDMLARAIETLHIEYSGMVAHHFPGMKPEDASPSILGYQVGHEVARRALRTRIAELEGALKPFADIVPSSLYPIDGSEAEEYIVLLRYPYANPLAFTGKDLANARTALKAHP